MGRALWFPGAMQDTHAFAANPIAQLYASFADESAPTSPTWARLSRWIAETPEVQQRLDALPGRKRQPNLFLGAVKYLDGPTQPGGGFASWLEERWDEVERVILKRATQTNEPGRCSVFAPILASLPQPVALLELGASAGLCLLPERYRYELDGVTADGAEATDASPVLASTHRGSPPASPADLRVAFREGIDANPLDASDADDARWLRALVWPGEERREERLAAALAVAAQDPPRVRGGMLPDDLGDLLAGVPDGATPVVLHSAVLAYLGADDRREVIAQIRRSGAHWLSFEGTRVIEEVRGRVEDGPHFVAALDGEAVAKASPHGAWVEWL